MENWLDDDFPLGDGTAETAALVSCPYCGEVLELAVDPGGTALQQYIEDCQVCCRPMLLTVRWERDGAARVEARTEEGE